MKITLFGANSPTGRLLADRAVESGYQVNAFVRDASRIMPERQGLRVIVGDALSLADVDAAVRGTDAVLSTLGPKGKPAVMVAEATQNIVRAMQNHKIRRLVVVSVAGVPVPQDRRGFDPISGLIRLFVKDMFRDREAQLAVLEASGLDWVAVRVSRLTDGPERGSVRAFFGRPAPNLRISRADLAAFMLQQVVQDRWVRQAPLVGY